MRAGLLKLLWVGLLSVPATLLVEHCTAYMWELSAVWQLGLGILLLLAFMYTIKVLDLLPLLWRARRYPVSSIYRVRKKWPAAMQRQFYLCQAPDGTTCILTALVYGSPPAPTTLWAYRSLASGKRIAITRTNVALLLLKTTLCYFIIITAGYLYRHG